MAASLLALMRAWRQRGRVRRRLAAMSGRELRDIGACGSEVANEIAKPFWEE